MAIGYAPERAGALLHFICSVPVGSSPFRFERSPARLFPALKVAAAASAMTSMLTMTLVRSALFTARSMSL